MHAPARNARTSTAGGVNGLLAVVAALATALLLLLAPAASAVEPFRLQEQVTDQVGALSGSEAEVQDAIDELRQETGLRLFVVFVDSFEGQDGQTWAQRAGDLSQLGTTDAVLAVATGDRAYGSAVSPDVDTSAADVAARDQLSQEDWAGAVDAFASTLAATMTGDAGSGSAGDAGSGDVVPDDVGSSGGISGIAVLFWLLVVGVLVVVAVAVVRSRMRGRGSQGPVVGGPREAPAAPPVPLPELEKRASSALVGVDDAVMTSATELEFARAEFGDEAVPAFEAALASARDELSAAFEARRRAEDASAPEAVRRQALQEVLDRCGRADAALDEQTAAFDELRDLGRKAPAVLQARTRDVAALRGQLPAAQQQLAELARRYADSAWASVASAAREAEDSLELAEEEITEGQQAVQAGDSGQAALAARGADQAAERARRLLGSIGTRVRELAEASSHLAEARAETEQDLAEAQALLDGTRGSQSARRDLGPLIARARVAMAEAEAAADAQSAAGGAGRTDPLTALRRLEEADAALDDALASVRRDRDRADRARAGLGHALLAARAEVGAAQDLIATRRGAIGGEARTLLHQAQDALRRAEAAAEHDPVAALADARRADELAEQAQQRAYDDLQGPSGPWGGGYGGRTRTAEAAVLGGILGAVLTGGGHHGGGFGGGWGGGGGFGGGGFGGGGGGGSFGGGGFGGGGGGGSF